jgi:hypothetical protein
MPLAKPFHALSMVLALTMTVCLTAVAVSTPIQAFATVVA